jgi:hypothetical protein
MAPNLTLTVFIGPTKLMHDVHEKSVDDQNFRFATDWYCVVLGGALVLSTCRTARRLVHVLWCSLCFFLFFLKSHVWQSTLTVASSTLGPIESHHPG